MKGAPAFIVLATARRLQERRRETTTAKTAEDAHNLAGASEAWCPDGFRSGANDSCRHPREVDEATPDLARTCTAYQGPRLARGVVDGPGRGAEELRGRAPSRQARALPWKAEFRTTTAGRKIEDTDASEGRHRGLGQALWQVDALMDQGSHKRSRFSNGFFASYVATHAMFPCPAWAIVDGGSIAPTPAAPTSPAPAKGKASPSPSPSPPSTSPILLVEAKDDADKRRRRRGAPRGVLPSLHQAPAASIGPRRTSTRRSPSSSAIRQAR